MNKPSSGTLAIFGGSGATGQRVIEQAMTEGFRVRALVRNSQTFSPPSGAVEVLEGSLLNPVDIAHTLEGCDSVCCVFGPRPSSEDIFCALATRIIVEAMERQGSSRLICQTGAMIGDYPHNRTWPFQLMVRMFNRSNGAMAGDRAAQEKIVVESGLDWTLVKPPRLTDRPPTGGYLAGSRVKVGMLSAISRSAVAAFIVDQLTAQDHLQEAVFVSVQ